ncbi:MAG: glycosyltransferase family 9 protein [Bacteroidota bacterium]
MARRLSHSLKRKPQTAKTKRNFHIPDCPRFTGYKPCYPGVNCAVDGCYEKKKNNIRILIVNLDAMGNVLTTTSILPAMKRKYPGSIITWITMENTHRLLDNNQYIDRVFVWGPESRLILGSMKFDIVMNVDKSQRSGAFTMGVRAKKKLGYGVNERGQIIPLNKEAEYNYLLGLDDHLKFRVNTRTVSDILHQTMKLDYRHDEYVLNLTEEEEHFCNKYAQEQGLDKAGLIVGFNTGCSTLYPNKKMTVDQHVALIDRLYEVLPQARLVLLGGSEDTERNIEIARRVGEKVLSTPTTEGVRRGICYENLCDVVITGDSFGMQAAIGLKKYVIAWFGLSCWTEIDLYSRGEKLYPQTLECAPCWKLQCPYNLECIQMIDLERIVELVKKYFEKLQTSNSQLIL